MIKNQEDFQLTMKTGKVLSKTGKSKNGESYQNFENSFQLCDSLINSKSID